MRSDKSLSLASALRTVKQLRPVVAPNHGFMAQLMTYEKNIDPHLDLFFSSSPVFSSVSNTATDTNSRRLLLLRLRLLGLSPPHSLLEACCRKIFNFFFSIYVYFVAPARLYSPRAFQNRSWSGRARRGAGATEHHLEGNHYPVQL